MPNDDHREAAQAIKESAMREALARELEIRRQGTLAAQDAERLRMLACGRAVKVPCASDRVLGPMLRPQRVGLRTRRARREIARFERMTFQVFAGDR